MLIFVFRDLGKNIFHGNQTMSPGRGRDAIIFIEKVLLRHWWPHPCPEYWSLPGSLHPLELIHRGSIRKQTVEWTVAPAVQFRVTPERMTAAGPELAGYSGLCLQSQ